MSLYQQFGLHISNHLETRWNLYVSFLQKILVITLLLINTAIIGYGFAPSPLTADLILRYNFLVLLSCLPNAFNFPSRNPPRVCKVPSLTLSWARGNFRSHRTLRCFGSVRASTLLQRWRK